jgi:hypothetical protein
MSMPQMIAVRIRSAARGEVSAVIAPMLKPTR